MKALARAKINLTLHVGRVIADTNDAFFGYHPLDSIVVFAGIGDVIEMQPADETGLQITGPFSQGLSVGADNLILRAAFAAKASAHNIRLNKRLPVSAGIGGGSANAAAVLRLCGSHDPDIAVGLGADVPVCLLSKTARMSGIGEKLDLLAGLGQLYAVLVNPGVAVSTAEIFKAFDAAPNIPATPKAQKSGGDLLSRALAGENDLQPIAIAQAPIIGDVLRALSTQDGCQLARMSGSGATCFGIFESAQAAQAAQSGIQALGPDWWVVATELGEAS